MRTSPTIAIRTDPSCVARCVPDGRFFAFWLLPPHADFNALYVLIAFFVGYCVTLFSGLLPFRSYQLDATFLILVGTGIIFAANPYVLIVISLALYVVICSKVSFSLEDFPYTEKRRESLGLVPYEQLQPVPVEMPIGPVDLSTLFPPWIRSKALLISALTALVFFVAGFHLRDSPDFARGMLFFHGLISLVLVCGRVIVYCRRTLPPISFSCALCFAAIYYSGV